MSDLFFQPDDVGQEADAEDGGSCWRGRDLLWRRISAAHTRERMVFYARDADNAAALLTSRLPLNATQVAGAYPWPDWAEADEARLRRNASEQLTDADREKMGVIATPAYTFIPSNAVNLALPLALRPRVGRAGGSQGRRAPGWLVRLLDASIREERRLEEEATVDPLHLALLRGAQEERRRWQKEEAPPPVADWHDMYWVEDTGEEVARKDLAVFQKYLANLEKPPLPADPSVAPGDAEISLVR
ncbi:hypothetical protein T484DRAFT_1907709 [Baffinella frigidus]|nr:hypothetical protein T484DRAFT_1907709 [Cryptophyta sp. CCMP2293]